MHTLQQEITHNHMGVDTFFQSEHLNVGGKTVRWCKSESIRCEYKKIYLQYLHVYIRLLEILAVKDIATVTEW